MKLKKPIYVTRPFLPPLEEYNELLKKIWNNGILTNDGRYVNQFEKEMSNKFRLSNFITFTSGTTALQMAIRALGIKGEIITTPFTWIATLSAIKMENCTPKFCDIDTETFNMDPSTIEKCITEKTVAIMPVHVFGNPCDIDRIQKVADSYNLKVIYDAAHAIGATFKGESVLEYGDISAVSLHATKLLNTGEGGGCITKDKILAKKIESLRFFGYNINRTDIIQDGLNGKLTELQSALGVVNLKYFDKVLEDRAQKSAYYKEELKGYKSLRFQKNTHGTTNHSYFPVVFKNETLLLKTLEALSNENIFPRRYFYPSVNTFKNIVIDQKCAASESLSKRILCLPLFYDLDMDVIKKIIMIIKKSYEK